MLLKRPSRKPGNSRPKTAANIPEHALTPGSWLIPQIIGSTLCLVIARFSALSLTEHLLLFAGLQGAFAAIVSRIRRDPAWWIPIHLGFVPLVVLASRLAVPAEFWLAGFILLLLVFWRTDKSRVPLYLTNEATSAMIAHQLPSGPAIFLDLGCGDAGLIRHLARLRPDCRFVGFEHAPLTWAWARWTTRRIPNIAIHWGNFWTHRLDGYDLVYAFLSPAPMPRLWAKATTEMKSGAVLLSNSFDVPNVQPEDVIEVSDGRKTLLFRYLPRSLPSIEKKRPDCPPA